MEFKARRPHGTAKTQKLIGVTILHTWLKSQPDVSKQQFDNFLN